MPSHLLYTLSREQVHTLHIIHPPLFSRFLLVAGILHNNGDMRSMPVRKATPTSISEGEAYEQRDFGCRTFRCMGTGPQVATLGGCRYYVTFIDDFSRHTWIYPMRQKSEVFGHFQRFKAEAEKTTCRHMYEDTSDNASTHSLDSESEGLDISII